MIVLRLRSVEDELNVCENQPESRDCRSPMERVLGESLACRGIAIGSTTTAASSSRSLRGRNRLVLRLLEGLAAISPDDELLAIGVDSVTDRDRSRPWRWRNLGSFDVEFGAALPGGDDCFEAIDNGALG